MQPEFSKSTGQKSFGGETLLRSPQSVQTGVAICFVADFLANL